MSGLGRCLGNNILHFSFETLLWPFRHRLLDIASGTVTWTKMVWGTLPYTTACWPIPLCRLMGWGVVAWNSSKDVYSSPVLYQNCVYREAAHLPAVQLNPTDSSHPKHRFPPFLGLFWKILTIPPPLPTQTQLSNHSISPVGEKKSLLL